MENIRLVREEAMDIPSDVPVIVATGPLTSEPLARRLQEIAGGEQLHFYDAVAPIVAAESLDPSAGFFASRYGKGGSDYLNFPLTEEEYRRLVAELVTADKAELHGPDREARYFEGCMPIEEMARRGPDTLAHGPLKPVGLVDPRTGRRPFAVVQLRKENRFADQYNLVGFQTQLRQPEQKRALSLIPGMERAEFLRYGSVHRNTFVNAPKVLDARLRLKALPRVRLAGQVTGVEGYIESAATGILAGIYAAAEILSVELPDAPSVTGHGALIRHLVESDPEHFQPSNIHFGLFPAIECGRGRRSRRHALSVRATEAMEGWAEEVEERLPKQ
jgi:methylenetetrahydrofolate--tRNA-(uracil-5-)-methyltransferase